MTKKSKLDTLGKVTLEAKVLNQMKGSYLDWKKIALNRTEAVIWRKEAKHKNITILILA